jgi:two-component system phosphate regulon sensor histidine kinase PhoR
LNKKSFFNKYFTGLLVIFFFSLFSVGFFSTWTITRFSNGDTAQRLEEYLLVMNYFIPPMGFENSQEAQFFVDSAASAKNLRITLIDKEGYVLADSHADAETLDNHNNRKEVLLARQYGKGFSRRYSDTLKETYIYSAVFNQSSGMVLRISMAVSNIQQRALKSYIWVSFLTLLILGLSILISYSHAQTISKMLNSLKITAEDYASGDFSRSLYLTGFKEAHDLSFAVNAMGKQLQDKIQQITAEKEKSQAMLNQMSEPVLNLNRNLTILEANKAALDMADRKLGQCKGRNLIQIFRSKELCGLAEKVLKKRKTKQKLIYWKGEGRYLQVKVSLLHKDGEEESQSLLMVMNDVTEIKQMELMRKDFVGNVSHELRTPVTSILGYADTLAMRDKLSEDQIDDFIIIIQKQGKRLASIIEDLLILSSLEEEGSYLKLEKSSVEKLINRAVLFCQLRAQQSGVKFHYDLCNVKEITLHPNLTEQALSNLLDNAIKYGPDGGNIYISTIQRGHYLEFHIKDQGPGISVEQQARLFERFYRVDKARSRDVGGTGLGLAIVKHIAQKQKGYVSIKSSPGLGSDFIVAFPN